MATTLLWTSSAAKDLYFLIKRTIQSGPASPVTGVKTCSYQVMDSYYDTDSYRDGFTYPNGLGVVDNKESITNAGTNEKFVVKSDPETGTATYEQIGDALAVQSGSDAFMHVPPRPQKKSRTMLFFWSGAQDTSDLLFSCWMDEFRAVSLQPFGNI